MKGIGRLIPLLLLVLILSSCAKRGEQFAVCYNGRLVYWRGLAYFVNDTNEGLYQSNPDLGIQVLLALGCNRIIEVSDEGILFTGTKGLCRTRLDGTSLMILDEDFSSWGGITGKWIYYQDYDGGQLKRITRDGVEYEQIGEKGTSVLAAGENAVVLRGFSDNTLYYCIDESGPVEIPDLVMESNGAYMACFEGDEVYIGTPGGLCRYRPGDQRLTELVNGDGVASLQTISVGVLYTDSQCRLWLWPFRGEGAVPLTREAVCGDACFENGQNTFWAYKSWVYYLEGEQFRLMRTRTDGSRTEQLMESVYSADFAGGWIYCLGRVVEPDSGLALPSSEVYRIRPEGSKPELFLKLDNLQKQTGLSEEDPAHQTTTRMFVTQNALFICSRETVTACFSMSLEGGDRRELNQLSETDAMTNHTEKTLSTERGEFYTKYGGGIYFKSPDGREKQLTKERISKLQYRDGWLYYITMTGLVRTRWDGSKTERISDRVIKDFVMDESKLYFFEMEGFCVYSVNPDGSDPKVAAVEALPELLGAKGGWFVYRTSGGNLFRVCAQTRESQAIMVGTIPLQNAVYFNGWLYGDNGRDLGTMYRMDVSKGRLLKVARHSMTYVAEEGQNLYTLGNGCLWRLDTGTMTETCLAKRISSCTYHEGRLICTEEKVKMEYAVTPLKP